MYVLIWLYDEDVDRVEGPFDSAELAKKHDDENPRMYRLVDGGSMNRWTAEIHEVKSS
jgi:hypothetical protein